MEKNKSGEQVLVAELQLRMKAVGKTKDGKIFFGPTETQQGSI